MSEVLTATEAADVLGCSKETVCRLARAGELPSIRKSRGRTGAWLFDGQVVQLFAAHTSPRARRRRRGHGTAERSRTSDNDNA